MEMPEKIKSSVLKKIVGLFLLMIIPISIIAIIIYSVQIKVFEQNIIENHKTIIHNNLKYVEDEMKEMSMLMLESLKDENILKLAGMGNILKPYEKTTAVNRLFYHLELLKTNGKYTDNLYIYFPEMQRVLDAEENLYEYSFSQEELEQVRKSMGNYYIKDNKIYQFFSPMGTSFSRDRFNFLIILESDGNIIIDNLLENLAKSELSIKNEFDKAILQSEGAGDKISADNEENNPNEIWIYEGGMEEPKWRIEYKIPISDIYPQIMKLQIYFIVFICVFIIVTLFIIQKFYELVKSPIIQLMEQEDLIKTAKLKQLQSQINPHFLYNSFFVISNMARLSDVENIKRFSEYLAQYYHFIIQDEEEEIKLSDEIEHCSIYCHIQTMRFGERIEAEIEEIPLDWQSFYIPRLILQPLVENAFEYGLKNKEKDGIVRIHFAESDCELRIIVENNGELAEEDLNELEDILVSNSKLGSIGNIHRRLQLRYGEKSGLEVSRSSIGGLRVTITILLT